MQRSKIIAFNLEEIGSSSQQATFLAQVYISHLEVICGAIVKSDLHSGNLVSDNAWVESKIDKVSAGSLLRQFSDIEEVFFTRTLYHDIQHTANQLTQDDSITEIVYLSNLNDDDFPEAYWDHIDLEAMASGHVHYEEEDPDEVETIRIH